MEMLMRTALFLAALTLAVPASAEAAVGGAANLAALERYAQAYVNMASFEGVILVAEGNKIVYRKAFGKASYELNVPMTVDTRFRIASLTKDITKAAIGRLADRGLVSLDAHLSDYLPSFPNGDRITIRELLDNRSGVRHTNELAWMDMSKPMELPEILAHLAKEPLDFEPGTKYHYSNGGYALLAAVIEKVSGKSYEAFVRDEFARKGYPSIGRDDADEVVPKMAERYAPGPRLGERQRAQTYYDSNRVGGGDLYGDAADVFRVLHAAYFGDLVSPRMRAALFSKKDPGIHQDTGRSPGALAQISFDAEGKVTVVSLSSNSGWPAGFNRDLLRIYRGEPAPLTPFALAKGAAAEALADRVVGKYEIAEPFGWHVVIAKSEQGLVYQQDGDAITTALAPTVAGEYYLPIYDWLCGLDGNALTCRQRDPAASIRFVFHRQS